MKRRGLPSLLSRSVAAAVLPLSFGCRTSGNGAAPSLVLGLLAALCLGGMLWAGAADGAGDRTPPAPGVSIERVAWGGWGEAYRIANGEAELVVVPAVSRILHYGFVGGANLLWQNARVAGRVPAAGEWANYGGDKAWIWPQDDWAARGGSAWPPPTDLPATLASTALVSGKTLRLTSPRTPGYGVVIEREIRLADEGTRVLVTSRLRNQGGAAGIRLAAWTVTQMPCDGTLYARLMRGSRPEGDVRVFNGSFAAVVHEGRDVLIVERRGDQGAKLGLDADLLAWQRDGILVVARPAGPAARLSDFLPGERAQIYSHPDGDPSLPPGPAYVELELTSPRRTLGPGESVALETSLEAVRLSPEEMSRAAVADRLRAF
jgi:hypothetical protein